MSNQPAPAVCSGSLLAGMPDTLREEEFLPLLAHAGARIERIVSAGQASAPGFWYDQAEDEFVLLVAGAAVLSIAGRADPLRLEPGDWVHLPAHCRHRVEWTQAHPLTVWLAVFLPAAGG